MISNQKNIKKSKKASRCLLFLLLFVSFVVFCAQTRAETWKTLKGSHFVVYYARHERFAKDILDHAERYYKQIAAELGYQRYSDFWTWEHRVGIYLYPDKASFLDATGQPRWSAGMADYTNKKIIGYIGSERFIDSILPHEMAHLIFRDYVGFTGEIPLWLDEGVAQWMEPAKRKAITKEARRLLQKQKNFIPLKKLTALEISAVSEQGVVDAFYIEAISLVGFLIEQYGSEQFITFCRQLRDGKSLDGALRFAYPAAIRSIEDLESRWRAHLGV